MSAAEWIANARADLCDPMATYMEDAAIERLVFALDALDAVLALHRPGDGSSQGYAPDGSYGNVEPYCAGCEAADEYAVLWPCPTVRAIESALRANS